MNNIYFSLFHPAFEHRTFPSYESILANSYYPPLIGRIIFAAPQPKRRIPRTTFEDDSQCVIPGANLSLGGENH